MELTRRTFLKWLGGAIMVLSIGGIHRWHRTTRRILATAVRRYPGRVHASLPPDIFKPGRWLG
jgi:hypothetical protein